MPEEAKQQQQQKDKSSPKFLSGIEKVAILMISIDKVIAKSIFDKLDNYEIKKISDAMARLGVIQEDRMMTVLHEFTRKISAGGGAIVTDDEAIRNMLFSTLDEKRANQIFTQLNLGRDSALRALNTYDGKTLANFLINEHPQTIAILLAHLKTEKIGEVLKYLPEDVRVDAIMRMASLEDITPETLADLEDAVRSALGVLGTGAKHSMGGVDQVAETLNRIEKKVTNSIIEGISTQNPDLAEAIKSKMFVFEDMGKIDNRGIQEILKNIDNDELVLALKVATNELKEKVFANMSERAAKILQEDLQVMGPVKLSDVEKAQNNILKVVDRLMEEGKVLIVGEGDEEIVR